AEAIEAVDFEYLANGKKYNGFYARPKHLSKQEKHPIVILNRGGSNPIAGAKKIEACLSLYCCYPQWTFEHIR
ncbi:MAG: hypothetical protein ACSLEX_04235, partial [Minisyncoccota bacterium]